MFVAKVAGSRAKPDGLLVVPAAETVAFLAPLPITALWGVGSVTAKRLSNFGLNTIRDIQRNEMDSLVSILGDKLAHHLHNLAMGIDERTIEDRSNERSIGRSNTFGTDLTDVAEMHREVLRMATDVAARARIRNFLAHTVTVTVRLDDWSTVTRSHTFTDPTHATKLVAAEAVRLFDRVERHGHPVRLIGVRLENLVGEGDLGLLWEDEDDGHHIDDIVDAVAGRYGFGTVQPASLVRPNRPSPPD
jgi:DNA polymerase-4